MYASVRGVRVSWLITGSSGQLGYYSREKGSNSSKDVLPDREVNLGSDLFGENIADFATRLNE